MNNWWATYYLNLRDSEKKFVEKVSERVPLWLERIASLQVFDPTAPTLSQISDLAFTFIKAKYENSSREQKERYDNPL